MTRCAAAMALVLAAPVATGCTARDRAPAAAHAEPVGTELAEIGCTTQADAPAAGPEPAGGEPEVGVAGADAGSDLPPMLEPMASNVEPCRRDDECVLSTFECNPPCGNCPGTLAYGILRRELEAMVRRCERERPQWEEIRRQVACSPCPDVGPGFRQWTAVECRDGRCAPTTPGEPGGPFGPLSVSGGP